MDQGIIVMSVLLGFLAFLCGVILTSQIGSNALLGKLLGDSYVPAAINMLIGVVTTGASLLIVHKPLPSGATAATISWYVA